MFPEIVSYVKLFTKWEMSPTKVVTLITRFGIKGKGSLRNNSIDFCQEITDLFKLFLEFEIYPLTYKVLIDLHPQVPHSANN